ncbi:MAG: bifunctional nuclease family protein [Atopobiaceae bacterium]
MVILRPRNRVNSTMQLPIRIGSVEAAAISVGIEGSGKSRPLTHDLLNTVITRLGGRLVNIVINNVEGTTFYAQLKILLPSGDTIAVDSRPSDALALSVREHVPIFATQEVLDTAALPDFGGVEADEKREEMARFHEFVENLDPSDFNPDNDAT